MKNSFVNTFNFCDASTCRAWYPVATPLLGWHQADNASHKWDERNIKAIKFWITIFYSMISWLRSNDIDDDDNSCASILDIKLVSSLEEKEYAVWKHCTYLSLNILWWSWHGITERNASTYHLQAPPKFIKSIVHCNLVSIRSKPALSSDDATI
jgi:hypothetical protein